MASDTNSRSNRTCNVWERRHGFDQLWVAFDIERALHEHFANLVYGFCGVVFEDLLRISSQMFSCGLSSGECAGSRARVTFTGIASSPLLWLPAPSTISRICDLENFLAKASKKTWKHSASDDGNIRNALAPSFGLMAPYR